MSDSFMGEDIIPVDIDQVARDEALTGMPDGPAKRLLTTLCRELDHDDGEPPPMLIVRRAQRGSTRGRGRRERPAVDRPCRVRAAKAVEPKPLRERIILAALYRGKRRPYPR